MLSFNILFKKKWEQYVLEASYNIIIILGNFIITTEIILSFKYDRREISKIKKTLQLTTYYRDH